VTDRSGHDILAGSGAPQRKPPVSIVRVGLSETQKFAEGYSAIFNKRSRPAAKKARSGKATAKKKPTKKK
jgi:hypothetical protein